MLNTISTICRRNELYCGVCSPHADDLLRADLSRAHCGRRRKTKIEIDRSEQLRGNVISFSKRWEKVEYCARVKSRSDVEHDLDHLLLERAQQRHMFRLTPSIFSERIFPGRIACRRKKTKIEIDRSEQLRGNVILFSKRWRKIDFCIRVKPRLDVERYSDN